MTRLKEKASDDVERLHALLDSARLAHVGLVADGFPLVLPTAFVRNGDDVLVHGSTGSRWMRALAGGVDACLAVTSLDAVVVARSAFESSFQYRSAVVFGRFTALDGAEKQRGLDVVVDKLIPGRLAEVRTSTVRELAATLILSMPLETWSLRISDGWPEDEPGDLVGPAWAGVVPIRQGYGEPAPAPDLSEGISVPASVRALVEHPPPTAPTRREPAPQG
jgi:nitroimidazol reductase NimA-like FMN-containing flavoprotein (pyridoxamine 5'-phosphate oxidase superfamily)